MRPKHPLDGCVFVLVSKGTYCPTELGDVDGILAGLRGLRLASERTSGIPCDNKLLAVNGDVVDETSNGHYRGLVKFTGTAGSTSWVR